MIAGPTCGQYLSVASLGMLNGDFSVHTDHGGIRANIINICLYLELTLALNSSSHREPEFSSSSFYTPSDSNKTIVESISNRELPLELLSQKPLPWGSKSESLSIKLPKVSQLHL